MRHGGLDPAPRGLRICRTALTAGLFVLSLVGARSGWGRPIGYSAMLGRLRAAASTGRVRIFDLGKSGQGRAIPLAAIGPDDAPVRVLVLCRQHGDEPASTDAALGLIARAARGDRGLAQGLDGVLLLVAPMVNPDGAERGTRESGLGADLNRDWERLSQPETRAVTRVFRQLAPQVVLDEHEWTPTDHFGSDSLEFAGSPASEKLAETIERGTLGAGAEAGIPLRPIRSSPYWDARLAHRHFGSLGAAAFLLETLPNVDPAARRSLYERIMVRAARVAAAYAPESDAPGDLSELSPLFPSPVARVRRSRVLPEPVLAGLACVMLFLTGLHGRPALRGRGRHGRDRRRARRVPLRQVADLAARLERRRPALCRRAEHPMAAGRASVKVGHAAAEGANRAGGARGSRPGGVGAASRYPLRTAAHRPGGRPGLRSQAAGTLVQPRHGGDPASRRERPGGPARERSRPSLVDVA